MAYEKRKTCRYCEQIFSDKLSTTERANHTRWCEKNPKRNLYNKHLDYARSCITSESREKQKQETKQAHAEGKYCDAPKKALATKKERNNLKHTEQTKNLLREKALASNHRRILRSTRIYIKKDGSQVLLDSSWEESLAIRLDELNIEWIRPNPIKWTDDLGKEHNYFPDFYLPKQNVYLDPKNPQVYKMSLDKIKILTDLLPNLIILKTLNECKTFNI